jgi:putative DNA primase/helicase
MGDTESPEAARNKPLQQKLLSLPDTDAGNAEAFVLLYGDRFRYDRSRGKRLSWNGRFWEADDRGEVERAALATVRARRAAAALIDDHKQATDRLRWALRSESVSFRESMLRSAQSIEPFATTSSEYDVDIFLFTVGNGTLNLGSGEILDARPRDLITKATDVVYEANASCPRWRSFLREIFAGDEEVIDFIQRAVGYSLTGDIREQCLFILFGQGANGKTTFLETVLRLLGTHAVTTAFSAFLAQRSPGLPRNDLATLRGARFVKAAEAEHQARLDEAIVKQLTGGDTISARFLYHEQFSFKPQFKIWLATNHKPDIRGTDNAIWRRIRLIPFSQQFNGRADRALLGKLEAELDGILAWAVAGCRSWLLHGLGNARTVEVATHAYKQESDQFGRFLEERCARERRLRTPGKNLYEAYAKWCVSSGEKPASNTIFAAALIVRGISKKRLREGVVYEGLGLLPAPSQGSDLPSVSKEKGK